MFKNFIHPITPEEPYINIVMVGETGAGKSSFINTFATALANKNYMKDIYRISPKQTKHKEKSATRKVTSMYHIWTFLMYEVHVKQIKLRVFSVKEMAILACPNDSHCLIFTNVYIIKVLVVKYHRWNWKKNNI